MSGRERSSIKPLAFGCADFSYKGEKSMKHYFEVEVYYADTDCYGVVWHGTYVRYCEQARTDFVAKLYKGMKYFEDNNIATPIVNLNIKYKNFAKIHDVLVIETTVEKITPLRATMLQKITNKITGEDVAEATIDFVCTDNNGKLYRKMPQEMVDMLKKAQDA